MDTVQVPKIRNKQTEQQSTPDLEIVRHPQNQRFIDSEGEIQVRELSQNDAGGDRDATQGGTRRMGQVQV